MAEGRNAALALATGDLVLFVDGGCVLETFALKTLLKARPRSRPRILKNNCSRDAGSDDQSRYTRQVYRQTGAAAVSSFVKFHKGDIDATASAALLSATPGTEQWFQVRQRPITFSATERK
jgi:hypothetical protein